MDEQLQNYKGKETGRGIKKCLPLETGDLTASLDLILNSIELNKGQMRGYPNTQQGLEMFKQNSIDFFRYMTELNANPEITKKLIPDIEAWALYIGVSRITIFNYEKRGGEWAETIAYFKNAIATGKKQMALNYKIPPVLTIFDLKCNHGYNEQGEQDTGNRTGSKLDEEIAAAGLVFDEATGEFIPNGGI